MTDSESDLSNPNVFTFQNVNTTVSARGPNTNITNFSFRNQLTSTMCMPRNFERQRYAESVSDQRSIYYRRETSPMSIHSACDIRPRSYQQQYYNGMGSQKSVFNGRSGSPMSMRSIDSNASCSAADIAFAFKNVKFNKNDLKVIKEAYNKLMKQQLRKRIEKRRNMRMFLKGSRRRSGDDSGEQGSDSSISSDDCRSVKTSYKENMSSSRSTRTDLTDFRKRVRDSNMLKDCTENFRQSSFKNMFSVGSSNSSRYQNVNTSIASKSSNPQTTLQERFKNGFLLPSQRFNRSVASIAIPESSERNRMNCVSNKEPSNNPGSGSDEEIFSNAKEKSVYNKESQNKRSYDSDDDSSLPNKKRSKISSPTKNYPSNKMIPSKVKNNLIHNNNDNSNSFEFAKPTLPIRKSKTKVQEKVIAKSKQPLTGFVELPPPKIASNLETVEPTGTQEKPKDDITQVDQSESSQNSDVSMRPSFIKRKLFTQKLDVAEKANLSSEGINSPQNGYSVLQKEKNKARKLVTSQSCLNREVQDDNNLLDLIHKIVPPDRINQTNQTINQTKPESNNKDDDKWDVTSVISMCNEHEVSDTFTDEEIFINKTDPKPMNNPKKNCKPAKECKIVVEKLNVNQTLQLQTATVGKSSNSMNTNASSTVKNSAKTFWDTDFESDVEYQVSSAKKNFKTKIVARVDKTEVPSQEFKRPVAVSYSPELKNKIQGLESSRWLNNTKNNTLLNNTVDSTRKLNVSSISLRSHRTATKKKCCNATSYQVTKSKPEKDSKNVTKINQPAMTEPIKNSALKSNPKTDVQTKTPVKNSTKTKAKNKTSLENNSNAEAKSKTSAKSNSNAEAKNKTAVKNNTNAEAKNIKNTETKDNKNSEAKNKTSIKNNTIIEAKNKSSVKNKTNTGTKDNKNAEAKNKTSVKNNTNTETKDIKNEAKNKTRTKSNTRKEIESNAAKLEKPKSITKNANKSRSTFRTRKSPKKTKENKQKRSPKQKYQSPRIDRPIRSCRTPSQNRSLVY